MTEYEKIKDILISESSNLQSMLKNPENEAALQCCNKITGLLFRLFDEVEEPTDNEESDEIEETTTEEIDDSNEKGEEDLAAEGE